MSTEKKNTETKPAKPATQSAKGAGKAAGGKKNNDYGISIERGEHVAGVEPRYKKKYFDDVVPGLVKAHPKINKMEIPKLVKIIVNSCQSEATQNIKVLEAAVSELEAITGQKAVFTRAKKSIAAFKLRSGMPIGAIVTLRGNRMYEFYDKLVSIALPRIRDFRGVSSNSFDGKGNYSLGFKEQTIFPEIEHDKVDKARGLSITIVTSAKEDSFAKELLEKMDMPFRK